MKKKIFELLKKISRIIYYIYKAIYYILPRELRKSEFRSKLLLKLQDNLADETFNHFKEKIKKSLITYTPLQSREYSIQKSIANDKDKKFFYLEFGVFKGKSANFFSKYVKELYCFDSFEGLKEDWVGKSQAKGHFNLNKKIPKLNSNVKPIVGWVEDTLEDFLKKYNPKINFVHLDMDTYSPTKFTLEKIKPYLVKNAIIHFDELYNYFGWENGEYKALREVFDESEFEYIMFNIEGKQCAIQIL
jgi:hypothetical protein